MSNYWGHNFCILYPFGSLEKLLEISHQGVQWKKWIATMTSTMIYPEIEPRR